MNDIQRLIDNTIPFVEKLLNQYGEFFPLSSAIKTDDSLVFVSSFDGNDRPPSEKVITNLKEALNESKEQFKVFAIFYDVRVEDPNTNLKTDAVAILVETKKDNEAFTFYYPYRMSEDKKILFSNHWKVLKEKEII